MKRKDRKFIIYAIATIMIAAIGLFCFTERALAGKNKTLKVGVSAWLGWPIGLDFVNNLKVMIKSLNEKGGLKIGGEKYTIELIIYDSGNDQAQEKASINRLVYQDKVKFILSDGTNAAAWVPITEKNKVVVNVGTPAPPILSPKNHYVFNSALQNCSSTLVGWLADNLPDKKNVVQALPDFQIGHLYAEINKKAYDVFGLNITYIFYPMDSQDLSAIGTKVRDMNPDVFSAIAGGPMLDGLAFKAVYQAGYKGQFFVPATPSTSSLLQIIPKEAAEGYISGAWPTEFDPALTPAAKELKDAYIAEHGKWEDPEIMTTSAWSCLKTALQKAGSVDVDKVAEVIGSGLRYEGPTGLSQMVSRPDMGNKRTIDSVTAYNVKQIVGGKPKLIDQMSLEKAQDYFLKIIQ